MKKMHKAKQKSNQHKRKHNPTSSHRSGLIVGKKSGGFRGILNSFKK